MSQEDGELDVGSLFSFAAGNQSLPEPSASAVPPRGVSGGDCSIFIPNVELAPPEPTASRLSSALVRFSACPPNTDKDSPRIKHAYTEGARTDLARSAMGPPKNPYCTEMNGFLGRSLNLEALNPRMHEQYYYPQPDLPSRQYTPMAVPENVPLQSSKKTSLPLVLVNPGIQDYRPEPMDINGKRFVKYGYPATVQQFFDPPPREAMQDSGRRAPATLQNTMPRHGNGAVPHRPLTTASLIRYDAAGIRSLGPTVPKISFGSAEPRSVNICFNQ